MDVTTKDLVICNVILTLALLAVMVDVCLDINKTKDAPKTIHISRDGESWVEVKVMDTPIIWESQTSGSRVWVRR